MQNSDRILWVIWSNLCYSHPLIYQQEGQQSEEEIIFDLKKKNHLQL